MKWTDKLTLTAKGSVAGMAVAAFFAGCMDSLAPLPQGAVHNLVMLCSFVGAVGGFLAEWRGGK